MVSVNLGLEMITDVDKALGPENSDERCWRAAFPSVFGLTTLCFAVVMLSLNCGKRNLKHLAILSLVGNRVCHWKFRMTVVRFLTLTGGSGHRGCREFEDCACQQSCPDLL
jgi:hypothetical protein